MKSFAFVFPGQGSQSVGMLDGWGDHPVVAQTLQEASDALGENIGQLIKEGPKEAHGDTLNYLRKYKPKALVHCFSGSVEMMREVMRYGSYISLGGVVTFKNARHSVEVAKEVPIDRLLLETDCPYMSPVPFRGKRCDSTMIKYTAEKIAEIRNTDVQELLNITAENAKRFYGID